MTSAAADADQASVTVVIPTLNRQDVLVRRALCAALVQQGVKLEVIVVDDGSEPPIGPFEDVRVRVVRHAAPRGVAAARNTGIRDARGSWVAFLDDDDIWSPDKLRQQLAVLVARADFCYSAAVVLDAALKPLLATPAPHPQGLATALAARNVIPAGASNVVARTKLVRDLGGFDESFTHLDDWDCWLRLASAGTSARCESVHVGYVLHAGARVQRDHDVQEEEFARLCAKHAALSRQFGVAFDLRDFRRYLAVGHRRSGRRRRAAGIYAGNAVRFRSAGDVGRAAIALAGVPPRRSRRPSAPSWVDAYR